MVLATVERKDEKRMKRKFVIPGPWRDSTANGLDPDEVTLQ